MISSIKKSINEKDARYVCPSSGKKKKTIHKEKYNNTHKSTFIINS